MPEDWTPGDPLSQWCHDEQHADCGHWIGNHGNLLTALVGAKSKAILCQCLCHQDCPTAVGTKITQETWIDGCTCPGASSAKESFSRRRGV
jgi:hypothetical protein